MKLERKAKHIIAVGGGKGGVGKSVCSAALAFALAKKGKRTVLADFDLGAANLHTYLGLNTPCTLTDFMHKKVESLEDVIVPTGFENLSFIAGGDYSFGAANPAHWMQLKVMRHIHAIDADFSPAGRLCRRGFQYSRLQFHPCGRSSRRRVAGRRKSTVRVAMKC